MGKAIGYVIPVKAEQSPAIPCKRQPGIIVSHWNLSTERLNRQVLRGTG